MYVLDVGCGTGRSTHFIAERGVRVVGIDMVEQFIEEGKKLYPHLDLRVMNATKLDFPDASFDMVFFSNQGIDYSDRRFDILKEMHRVAKPGATFAYSAHNSLYLPRTVKGWKNLLKNAGRLRLGYHFRVEHHKNGDLYVAHTNVWSETRLLRKAGFEVIEILSNSARFPRLPRILAGLFTRWPMYVCRTISHEKNPLSHK
jgi:SAM-dependent methyltransferase